MARKMILLVFFFSFLANAEKLTIHSEILKTSRTVTVKLPESYLKDESGKPMDAYPTFYVLDGGWYGDLSTTIASQANKFVPLLPDFIVVSVHSENRWQDFTDETVFESDRKIYQGPYQASKFRQFLKNELIPKIENQYRTNGHRLAFGFSLSGGFLVESLYKNSDLFTSYILVSPYLKWNHDAALRDTQKLQEIITSNNKSIVLSVGEDEDENTRGPTLALFEGIKDSPNSWLHDYPGENHSSMPNASLYRSLKTLYGSWFPQRTVGMAMNGEEHVVYFQKQHQRYFESNRIQPGVYRILFKFFGNSPKDKELLCGYYLRDTGIPAETCTMTN